MFRGRIAAELSRDEATEARIAHFAGRPQVTAETRACATRSARRWATGPPASGRPRAATRSCSCCSSGSSCFFSLTQPDFFSQANIENLLTGSSILFVVSIGMTFVVLTGGIDLSVGSLLALSGIILSELFNDVGLPAPLAVVGTCLIAALLGGAVNGVLIGRLGLSFFVVTLGTLSIYRGVVNIWSDTETTYITSSFIDSIAFGKFLGIAYPIWIMAATYLVALVVLRWTYFGRDVYAVGGNITAARLSGINVARTLIMVYAIAGLCAGSAA